MKHFKNSQQIGYSTDHGISYSDRERKSPSFFYIYFTDAQMLIKKKNIVRFIKSQRLRWAAHVFRMDTIRTVKNSLNGNHVHQDQ